MVMQARSGFALACDSRPASCPEVMRVRRDAPEHA